MQMVVWNLVESANFLEECNKLLSSMVPLRLFLMMNIFSASFEFRAFL